MRPSYLSFMFFQKLNSVPLISRIKNPCICSTKTWWVGLPWAQAQYVLTVSDRHFPFGRRSLETRIHLDGRLSSISWQFTLVDLVYVPRRNAATFEGFSDTILRIRNVLDSGFDEFLEINFCDPCVAAMYLEDNFWGPSTKFFWVVKRKAKCKIQSRIL